MYSELLAGLCADVDPLPLPVSKDELVVILLQSRRRLNEQSGGEGEHIMTEDLALELDHDRMLLRLCTALGIETEPERFGNPLARAGPPGATAPRARRGLPDPRRPPPGPGRLGREPAPAFLGLRTWG